MRRKCARLAATLAVWAGAVALLAALPTPALAWAVKTYDNQFVVDFPGEPQRSQETVQTAAGPMIVRTLSLVTADGVYAVQYYDLPARLVNNVGTDQLLEKARDGAIARVNGRLVTEVDSMLEGYPGRAFLAALPDQRTHLAARTYIVRNRAFLVLASGSVETLSQPASRRFISSFGLLNRATPRDSAPDDDDFFATPEE